MEMYCSGELPTDAKGYAGLRRKRGKKGECESLLKQGGGKRRKNEDGWKEYGKQVGRMMMNDDDNEMYHTREGRRRGGGVFRSAQFCTCQCGEVSN